MNRFQAGAPNGVAVQQLEVLLRTAIFKPASVLVGFLLQAAVDRIDMAYQPKPGQHHKGRESLQVLGIFGDSELQRDYESTTYVSTFGPIEEFGPLLRQESIRRGMALASRVVLIIDGAAGLANMGRLCFPEVIQIVDFYHALEHAGKVLVALLGSKEHPEYKTSLGLWAKQRLKNQVETLIAQTRKACLGQSQAAAVETELGYFVNNVERMQYGTFRRNGFFIASGVIEAGCKTVIGARCKQSGMFWGMPGAESILALRCVRSSRRLDQFWKERLDAHAAQNDSLPLTA